MASPATRTQLKDFCLRRLGEPVIEVNVDRDQIEDCIDDAIQIFQDYHTSATKKIYLKHQITATDVTNEYIPIADDVHNVVRVLPWNSSSIGGGASFMSVKYQMALSDIANLATFKGNLAYYEHMGQYLSTLDMILTGQPIVEFSRYEGRMYIFGEWWDTELKAGDYIVLEAYQTIDPETNTGIYNNKFIKNYVTATIKERWGTNMSKFEGVQLPGGVTISGERLLQEAQAEKEKLIEDLRLEYEDPVDFFVG